MSQCLEECISLLHHPSALPQQQPATVETTAPSMASNVLLSNGQSNNGKGAADNNNFNNSVTGAKQSLI